ncbi:MAG: hypothetical protein JXA22_08420 [Candidatus Thermoplasmatota archaeon]|nr:hypothetical protein [Candidatus Thermoplasmatota archaeon]
MKKTVIFSLAAMMLMFCLVSTVSADEEKIVYQDEVSDFTRYGETTGHEQDMDIISVTCDDSDFPVVLELTVSGSIITSYESGGGSNKYVVLLDLDGDESLAEMSFQLDGTGIMTIFTSDGRSFPYDKDGFRIAGSKLIIMVDYSYFGSFDRVSDLAASSLQRFDSPSTTVVDSVNYLFGEDNEPFEREPATVDDDDISDDDAVNDIPDDDDSNETSGPSLLLVASSLIISMMLGGRKRRGRGTPWMGDEKDLSPA